MATERVQGYKEGFITMADRTQTALPYTRPKVVTKRVQEHRRASSQWVTTADACSFIPMALSLWTLGCWKDFVFLRNGDASFLSQEYSTICIITIKVNVASYLTLSKVTV